jgi:hypothetical protein
MNQNKFTNLFFLPRFNIFDIFTIVLTSILFNYIGWYSVVALLGMIVVSVFMEKQTRLDVTTPKEC